CLLLLDYDMPGLDGADVSKQIRADPSPAVAQIPTIMLTGHGGEESEVLCLQAGADDFVTKPIHPEVLRARIETQLRLRSMREQLLKQNEELEAWRGNLEQDLDAAQRTQRSLIPATPPALPGWEIAGFYRPVIQVGGDIYGWLRMRDGRMLFWIADATGHGAAAGHPPLLVARHDGRTVSIASTSAPLGLVAGSSFTETPVQLSSGDLFLLYTDGLYGAGESDQPRLAPALVAKQLLAAPGDAQ